MPGDVATAAIEVATEAAALPPHAAVVAAAAAKARRAQAAKILGGGVGKGSKRARRDAVTDRQHAALKRAAVHFFVRVKTPPSRG